MLIQLKNPNGLLHKFFLKLSSLQVVWLRADAFSTISRYLLLIPEIQSYSQDSRLLEQEVHPFLKVSPGSKFMEKWCLFAQKLSTLVNFLLMQIMKKYLRG